MEVVINNNIEMLSFIKRNDVNFALAKELKLAKVVSIKSMGTFDHSKMDWKMPNKMKKKIT